MLVKRRFMSLTLVSLCMAMSAEAQSFEEFFNSKIAEFDSYTQRREAEFEAFRDKANAEFAEMMSRDWTQAETQAPEPQPIRPEPVKPVVAEPNIEPKSVPLPFSAVIPAAKPPRIEPPKPIVPISEDEENTPPVDPSFNFRYYGTYCGIDVTDDHAFKLRSTAERDVAKAWKILSDDKYNSVVNDCIAWRTRLSLSDWGYARFVKHFADAFCGEGAESTVLQMYLLSQSGYDARIARSNNNLYVLLPFESRVYEYPYIAVDGVNYYIIDGQNSGGSFAVFDNAFPQVEKLSLAIAAEPKLAQQRSSERELASKLYKDVAVKVSSNKNLIDFYADYPRNNNWNIYARTSLSAGSKAMLYPTLKRSIDGKSEIESVNILLNFVQTAFEYKTDDEQFGQERPLFADETLFYPYCDCEDRSILFTALVEDLLGLDVVLLHYPAHLATAVALNGSATGDYVSLGGRKYLVCDPTYIGARAGLSMPDCRDADIEIITL